MQIRPKIRCHFALIKEIKLKRLEMSSVKDTYEKFLYFADGSKK
jgi:hypothetical protein